MGVGLGGQGRCKQRSEVFVKIQKKKIGRVGWGGGGVRMDVNEELKCLSKLKKNGGWGRVRGAGRGGQGRCEQRSEVFVKIPKQKFYLVGESGRGVGLGGQGRCEQRSEVLEKIQKKIGGGGRVGGGGGCERRIEVFVKIKKKIGGGVGGVRDGGSGLM